MCAFKLNRRQFLQTSVGTLMGASFALQASVKGMSQTILLDGARMDPHLALAWSHRFVDHDMRAWGMCSRICGVLDRHHLPDLTSILGAEGSVHTQMNDGDDVWVTIAAQAPALLRWLAKGPDLFHDHIWGAPWFNPKGLHFPDLQASSHVLFRATDGLTASVGPVLDATGPRVLVIDHGFPLQSLRQSGVVHMYKRSPMATMGQRPDMAQSHGAQVIGLLLEGHDGLGPMPRIPIYLYELPDEILFSLPYAALWPEVIDAIVWALGSCPAGTRLLVMLSLVSTDADRHSQSFISRSARALCAYAQSFGVELTWVMAAGNNHADQQNIQIHVQAAQAVTLNWHLPAQNFRPSFLECWFDRAQGHAKVEVKPPAGSWSAQLGPMSMAQRSHAASDRVQMVMRLPPTAAWSSHQPLASSGRWGLRMTFERGGSLSAHLSMMTASKVGMWRQAHLDGESVNSDDGLPTLSGLIPWMAQVVIAQALDPSVQNLWVQAPSDDQLSAYSGRCPVEADVGWRRVGVRVDASHHRRGVHAWSRHGHRIQRASGTSMAVPLVTRQILGLN